MGLPPFSLGIKDGYHMGRGTNDNKSGVTQIISNFIRLKKECWGSGPL
jgi:acetylornithine deacetylase/succinyl-diaminopimelate desuccinylase-like protein